MATAEPRERRERGAGSIYQDKDGVYHAVIETGSGSNRRRKNMKAATYEQAVERLAEARRRVDNGLPPTDPTTTTGAWLEWWLDNVLPGTVATTTERSYRANLRNHVIPVVGRVRLSALTAEHVVQIMRTMEAAGRKPKSIALTKAVLCRALSDAVKMDTTGLRRNVASMVRAPAGTGAKTSDRLTAEMAEAVLATVAGDRLAALAVLALYTGMRQAECLDLRWQNVDLDGGWLQVVKSKTRSGVRQVALPAPVVDALRQHRAAQRVERMAAKTWIDADLVFATTLGTRIHRRWILRWWHRQCIAAGIGRRRFHATRHTAATVMLNRGVPVEVVSKVLGHKSIAVTLGTYAEVLPGLQRGAADMMAGAFGQT